MQRASLFTISSQEDFLKRSLETFHYQYKHVEVYRRFVDYLGKDPSGVKDLYSIPFLPIELFKNHRIWDSSKPFSPEVLTFKSSGTTGMERSVHYVADPLLYQESIERSFVQFLGSPKERVVLGLLPSYQENGDSSLIYMVNHLMQESGRKQNGYYLYDHKALSHQLAALAERRIPVLLFGVSFALLDYLESEGDKSFLKYLDLTVLETGGMKGRKEEITKEVLLEELRQGFCTEKIYSEYSMTELLSQAYALEDNLYRTPPWMRVLIRQVEDPLRYVKEGRTGAINIIDLCNVHSCAFIATKDLGLLQGGGFKVLGRMDNSDVRGCSLLVV